MNVDKMVFEVCVVLACVFLAYLGGVEHESANCPAEVTLAIPNPR